MFCSGWIRTASTNPIYFLTEFNYVRIGAFKHVSVSNPSPNENFFRLKEIQKFFRSNRLKGEREFPHYETAILHDWSQMSLCFRSDFAYGVSFVWTNEFQFSRFGLKSVVSQKFLNLINRRGCATIFD